MANPIIDKLDMETTSARMILIIGQTGAGKSHFCNRVLGEDVEDVKESAHLSSCEAILLPMYLPIAAADCPRHLRAGARVRESRWERIPAG